MSRFFGAIYSPHTSIKEVGQKSMAPAAKTSLGEILRLFLRLGLTAFGGPAAHIGLMEREAVERRGWMSREGFLDLVGACNLLPGPGSNR